MAALQKIYNPKKMTYASMTIVDTPGLSRDQSQDHGHGPDRNPSRLAQLRESADCIVCVIPTFNDSDPQKEINALKEDLILADLEIVSNRITRIGEQKKRPLPKAEQDRQQLELDTLLLIQESLEAGQMPSWQQLTPDQRGIVRAFRLFLEKPRMILINTGDEETDHAKYQPLSTPEVPVVAVSVGLEKELAAMNESERQAFLEEMELPSTDRDALLRLILDASGQSVFITAGDKEVRTWLVRKDATALECAEAIHTDMARGFIRAEVMQSDDLIRLGSERAVKAENLARREPKDYIVKEGDILLFHFSSK